MPPNIIKIIFFISLFVRLFFAVTIYPGFDETYYFSYSLRPALSYFDHPPFVSFLAGIFPWLTGIINPLTIRLGAIILFSIAGLMFYFFSKNWLNEQQSIAAYTLFNITPMFFLGAGTMILPDSGLLFFWIIALFLHHRILFKRQPGSNLDWLLAGFSTGAAMLAKYHGIFLGFALVLFLLLYKRKQFLTIKPYLYGFAALLVFSPVLIWNVQHEFISFFFQGGRAVSSKISLNGLLQAIGGQAAYLTPMIFIPFIIILKQSITRGILKGDKEYQFYFFFGTVPVLIMNFISLLKPILPHWTLVGYATLAVPLGKWISHFYSQNIRFRMYTNTSIVIIFMLLSIAFLHINYGMLHLEKWAAKGWISQKSFIKDATLDGHGWQEVDVYTKKSAIDPDSTFLFTHKWFLSSAVEFATKGKFKTLCFNEKDSRAYGIWDTTLDLKGNNGIFICTNRYFINGRKKFKDYFASISSPDSVIIKRGGVKSKTIYFFQCENLLQNYPLPY